ncbi:MAG: TetR/AcrR family transcriptional regulator [Lachnospirales bacterium]
MKTITQRKLQKKTTHEKIYQTSIKLFKKHGFDNVTIEKICKNCDIAKGTFYVHYQTKSDILVEKLWELDGLYLVKYNELIDANKPILDKLKEYTREILIILVDDFGVDMLQTLYIHHLQQHDYEILLNEERVFYTSMNSMFIELISENNLELSFTYLEITRMYLSMLRGIIYDWGISNGNIDMVEVGSTRANFFLDNLVNA